MVFRNKGAFSTLIVTSTLGLFAPPQDAHGAQTDELTRMEQQIKVLQHQISRLREIQTERDAVARSALAQRRLNAERFPYRADRSFAQGDQASRLTYAPEAKYTTPYTSASFLTLPFDRDAKSSATPYAALTDTPSGATVSLSTPLKRGQFQIGGVRVTLGGFIEGALFSRSRGTTSDIATNLQGIPFGFSPRAHTSELGLTARQSRFALLVEGNVARDLRAQAYSETDFEGAGTGSNSRQSNSYVLRERVVYGQLINDQNNWTLLVGQNWSLLTLHNHGMSARDEQIPLTIDSAYVAGFNWTRNPQVRFVKSFAHGRYNVGLSVESPQQIVATGANGGYLPTGATSISYDETGEGINNALTKYSNEVAPDVIAKVSADPGWGHYELSGLMRFPHSRVSYLGYGKNQTRVAGGGGGGMILPLEARHKLNFQISGLVGQGVGRYGSSSLPDATIDRNGQLRPLPEASVLLGLYGNATDRLQLYSYAGSDMMLGRSSFDAGGVAYGYGNPLYNVSGCSVEGSASATCQTNIQRIGQLSAGFWWDYRHGAYGTLRLGGQYSYVHVLAYRGQGGRPTTDDQMFFVSMRYLPFQ